MERSQEVSSIDFATGDTLFENKRVWYKVAFSTSSKDSILILIAGNKGKSIFYTNPNIMSGALTQLYIENAGWCVDMSFKNVYNETKNEISRILNPYLPVEFRLHVPKDDVLFKSEKDHFPLIKECSGKNVKSYNDILGNEYEFIRQ